MTNPNDDDDDRLLSDLLDGKAADGDEGAQRRAPYERLVAMLREAPSPGWGRRIDARVEHALRAQRRRRGVLLGVGAAIAMAAMVAIVIRRGNSANPPRVAVNIAAPDGAPRRGTSHVGDRLVVTIRDAAPNIVVRVYREARPVAACPGDASCVRARGVVGLTVPLTDAGRYQVLFATSDVELPAFGVGLDATFDSDVLVLRKAGVQFDLPPPLIVNP